jgi:hypothetical protein
MSNPPTTSQLPSATLALLNGLHLAHVQAFPVATRPVIRRDTGEDDSASSAQQDGLIRTVVGGWLAGLASEERFDGAHDQSNSSTLRSLMAAVGGPVQHCQTNPSALLFRPTSSSTIASGDIGVVVEQGQGGSTSTEDDVDLATYLFPRLIRAIASLETASLLSDRPSSDALDNEEGNTYQLSEKVKDQLETFMVTIVQSLAEGGASLEWSSRESAIQGGVGRARAIVQELVEMLQSRFIYLNFAAVN